MPRIGEQDHGDAFRRDEAKPGLSEKVSALGEDAWKAKTIFLHPPRQSVTTTSGVNRLVLHRVDGSVRKNSFLARQMSLEMKHSKAKQIVSTAINTSTGGRWDNHLGVAAVAARSIFFQTRFKANRGASYAQGLENFTSHKIRVALSCDSIDNPFQNNVT